MARDRDTADRLRHDIDRGRAGDKVDFSDPAAAPLGTDAEAAGTPPSQEQSRRARAAEIQHRPKDPTSGRRDRTIRTRQFSPGRWDAWPYLTVAAVAVLALLGLLVI